MRQTVTQQYLRYTSRRHILGILMFAYLLMVLIVFPFNAFAEEVPEYEEITVFLNVQKIGGADIPALIVDEGIYLPVADIFSFLKIKNTSSSQLDSVYGFFISQQATYLVDNVNKRITFQEKAYDLKSSDLIKTESGLYLKSGYFGQVFGLDCIFNFRSLSVLMTTKLELPIIREMRQAEMRSNISRLKGEVKADTVIERKFPLLHFGMADWSVNNTQLLGGRTDTRLNLDLGTVILGGEANIRLNYNNNTPFEEKQQQYLWRFVNNERPYLRQVMAGKIYSQVTSSIFNPIVGVQFTNTPTTYRRSFGTYTLSDITEPNWVVELYVNNVLVDYMKADASGFYKFEVPLVYGNSAVKLKFYGPWGEERVKEQNINIPFNFLPPGELEYTLSAGVVEDTLSSRFSRASMNYGVTRRLTIGGGVEYLSSVKTGSSMPFISSSLRLLSGLLLSGEYTYGVRAKGMLSYRLPSNLQFEINYTKYHPGQEAIIYNYLEERKATVSIPVRGRKFSAYSRFSFNQIVLPTIKTTNAEMLWSGSVYGVSTNFTTYGLFNEFIDPYVYSNLSLAFRLPHRFVITPQAQYDYNNKELISLKTNLEKPLFKNGYLNLSYEQNYRSNTSSIEFGFRYDLSFAQTGFSFRNMNNDNHYQNTVTETARGSFLYDRKTKYVGTNNRTSVGKGGIAIFPFLDVNANGSYEDGEPKVAGLQFRINGGTIIQNEKDTTIRVLDLVPYTSYLLELDKNSFDNIAWQMKHQNIKVMVDPNQLKSIEVPIAVMGEASGNVYLGTKGQGRVLVCFYRNDTTLVARTLTESDGYFSYLGLTPGKYTVRIDPAQLKKINMNSTPEIAKINISASVDGDIVDGLDFKLTPQENDSYSSAGNTSFVVPASQMKEQGNSKLQLQPQVIEETVEPNKVDEKPAMANSPEKQKVSDELKINSLISDSITIIDNKGEALEAGSFVKKSNAFRLREKLERFTGMPVVIVYNDLYYSVRITGFSNRKTALKEVYRIAKSGFETPYVSRARRNTSSVQLGSFSIEEDALKYKETMMKYTSKKVVVIYDNQQYKVLVTGFLNHKAAADFVVGMEK